MATQEYAASVQGAAIRVTRLDAAGHLQTGATDSYTMTSFISVTFTPQYEAGDEVTQKGADGTVCVEFQAPDTLKQVTLAVAICNPDPEFTELVSGGILLTKQATVGDDGSIRSMGWASSQIGEDPSGNGVAIEVWSYAVINGKKAATNPYFRWIFPYAKIRQSGDRVVENGLLANSFEGFGLGNINYGTGPDGRWEWPSVADRPYLYARADWAPIGYNGFYTWDPAADPATEGVPVTVLPMSAVGTNVPGDSNYDPGQPIDRILAADDDTTDVSVPTVTSFTPVTGVAAGGTSVTITGTHFADATQVKFGTTNATSFTIVSGTKITTVAPAHAAGTVTVSVVNANGTGTSVGNYTYS